MLASAASESYHESMLEHSASPFEIYLSTVPGDAAGERAILARVVIPELERRAAALGIAVVLIDPLAAPGGEPWDLARRFAAIDTCGLFVGVLGERYGEPPAPLPDALLARQPWLSDLAGRGTAELEIRYALRSPELGSRILFYLFEGPEDRPGFQEPEAAARLAALKDLLRASDQRGLASLSYFGNDAEGRVAGLDQFARRMIENLWAALEAGISEAVTAEQPWRSTDPILNPPASPTLAPEKPLPLHEDVQFSVYRPRVVAPLEWYPLVVFAHLDELASELSAEDRQAIREIEEQAREAFAEVPQGSSGETEDSLFAIPDEAEITFVPEISGVRFNPPRATFLWLEALHREDFRMQAAPTLDGKVARGRLTVFWGKIILAELNLKIQVDSRLAAVPGTVPDVREDGRPYHEIFASYSHKDTLIVEEFERYVQSLGDRYLIDCKTLRAGEVWDDRLRELIRKADVFQLFWSRNAMQSTFVEQEWRYALSLGREEFIRPTYWEEPLPELRERGLPPEDLRRLHFYQLRGGSPVAEAMSAPAASPAPPPPPPRKRRSRGMKTLLAGSAVAAMLVAFLSLSLLQPMAMKNSSATNASVTSRSTSDRSFTLGNKVDPGGKIPIEAQSQEFSPGEAVIANVPVEGLPAGTSLRMRWIGPDGSTVAEEVQNVPAGPDSLNFELKGRPAQGAYRAEVWIAGRPVAGRRFEVHR